LEDTGATTTGDRDIPRWVIADQVATRDAGMLHLPLQRVIVPVEEPTTEAVIDDTIPSIKREPLSAKNPVCLYNLM